MWREIFTSQPSLRVAKRICDFTTLIKGCEERIWLYNPYYGLWRENLTSQPLLMVVKRKFDFTIIIKGCEEKIWLHNHIVVISLSSFAPISFHFGYFSNPHGIGDWKWSKSVDGVNTKIKVVKDFENILFFISLKES